VGGNQQGGTRSVVQRYEKSAQKGLKKNNMEKKLRETKQKGTAKTKEKFEKRGDPVWE